MDVWILFRIRADLIEVESGSQPLAIFYADRNSAVVTQDHRLIPAMISYLHLCYLIFFCNSSINAFSKGGGTWLPIPVGRPACGVAD
jgi:hypothetical protein